MKNYLEEYSKKVSSYFLPIKNKLSILVLNFKNLPLKNQKLLRLGVTLVLVLALPLFIWAIVTQRFNFFNRAASAETSGEPLPSPTPSTFIQVTYPNGGESFAPNQKVLITWSSAGVNQIAIDLIDSNGAFSTIALPMDASVGQFSWTIPSTWYGTSNQFKIKVYSYSDKTVFDTSDSFFTISYPTPVPTPTATPIAPPQAIHITYPNGSETLTTGQVARITWDSTSIDTVIITKINSDGSVHGVSWPVSIPNVGYYDWVVSAPNLSDDRYKIQIQGNTYGKSSAVLDSSDNYFRILQPTPSPSPTPTPYIKVTNPNGGETLVVGQLYKINWEANGVQNYDIYLVNNLGEESLINGINFPSTSYDWKVDSAIMANTNLHKIKIVDASLGESGPIQDQSDNYFKIITSPTATPSATATPVSTTPPQPSPTPITSCNIADINKDGIVDGKDSAILISNILTNKVSGDINKDGVVDLTDYSILVINYNKKTGLCK